MEVQQPGSLSSDVQQPWRTLGSTPLLEIAPWFSVHREQVQLAGGRVIDDFYRIVLPEFVVVAATTIEGEWILVRGYKHGPRVSTLSMPAGIIDLRESPQVAAERELREETGYGTTNWEALGSYTVDGNRECGKMHLFVARNCLPIQAPEHHDTEPLTVELHNRRDLIASLRRGEFNILAGAAGAALALLLAD
ncbi:MAG: NUDIX hydrolase [Planctomycetes bacterium]|nr:NUDIX hydrolase [Planctomycetota bacterium]